MPPASKPSGATAKASGGHSVEPGTPGTPVTSGSQPLDFSSINRKEGKLVEVSQEDATIAKTDRSDAASRRLHTKVVVFGAVASIVMYFVSAIYGMRYRYPDMFRWWDAMRAEKVQGQGKHNFSMYQVCTAANFAPAQSMLELLLVWKHLRLDCANFLIYCVHHFNILAKTNPKAKLTAIHWAGSQAQSGYEKLLGPKGWASSGCDAGTVDQKEQALIDNWNASAAENPWYHLFPEPTDSTGRRAFLSVPAIKELFGDAQGGAANACDASDFFDSKIGMLFSGGLCNVAAQETSSDKSAADIFSEYFGTHVSVQQSCNGAASAGAVQGAMSVGSGVAMMAMMIPFPGVGAIGAIGVKALAVAASTGAAAAVGAATSSAAARERCQQETAERG